MNTVHRAPALRKMALSTGVGCFTVSHISIIVINFLFWLCWVTAALWVFLDDAPGCHCPFVLCLDPQDCLRVGFCHRVLIKSGPGNRGLLACLTTHEAMSRISS